MCPRGSNFQINTCKNSEEGNARAKSKEIDSEEESDSDDFPCCCGAVNCRKVLFSFKKGAK